MPITITTRVENDLVQEIDQIAFEEAIDRSSVVRKFLILSLKQWKIDKSLQEYEQGKMTLWQAAQDCGISLWEMITEVQKRGIKVPYTMDDFKDDLKTI